MKEEDKIRIKKMIETEWSIQSLDDMAKMFFRIAESIGHPLINIDLSLTKSWGEQYSDYSNKTNKESEKK